MHKRLVRAVILLFIALAAALGVASAAGALSLRDDTPTTSTESNSWTAGAYSSGLGAA